VREGQTVAANIAAAIRGGEQRPFSYRPVGMLAALGRRSAVAEILGFKFSGFFAWWLSSSVESRERRKVCHAGIDRSRRGAARSASSMTRKEWLCMSTSAR
jgi:NADH dehydrogenase FAD-containing subunit